jgi:DNA polymerase
MRAVARGRQLDAVRREAMDCRRCDLHRNATQTVFGEGPAGARLMLVGEQPGEVEDEEGRAFVGPAGMLLREILSEVGLEERRLYVTNAVKHFKWRPRGTRRIHDTPNWSEIRACDHWLRLELALVRPRLLVCLGATAAQAVLGRKARVNVLRGRVLGPSADLGVPVVVTVHPAAVLRAGDRRREMRTQLTADLVVARDALRRASPVSRPRATGSSAISDRRSDRGRQARGQGKAGRGEGPGGLGRPQGQDG